MAREAIRRLYDVDQNSLVLTKLRQTDKYDVGTVAFRAKPGKLIDLDRLHESVWATRLSQGTSSGLVGLDVTAVGEVTRGEKAVLKVAGTDAEFVLARHPEQGHRAAFDQLKMALDRGEKVLSVSGKIDGWSGRWPGVLSKLPGKPRKILVTSVQEKSLQDK
jgi:hypothetical protein